MYEAAIHENHPEHRDMQRAKFMRVMSVHLRTSYYQHMYNERPITNDSLQQGEMKDAMQWGGNVSKCET